MLKFNAFLALTLFALTSSVAADAPDKPAPTFENGANCLFIGHSFFIPVARSFDKAARENGFASHQVKLVFAPGKRGSPADLWNNLRQKKQIEDVLATGKIDLMGMTVGGGNTFEDFQQ